MSGVGLGAGEGEAIANEVAVSLSRLGQLLKLPTISSGSTVTGAPTAGDQIVIGGPRLSTPNNNIFSGISDFFSNLFSPKTTPIRTGAGQTPSVDVPMTPQGRVNPNIKYVAAGGVAVSSSLIALSLPIGQGGQTGLQAISQGAASTTKNITDFGSKLTQFAQQNPLIIAGAVIIIGVIAIKK